jgi:hypothetical protein
VPRGGKSLKLSTGSGVLLPEYRLLRRFRIQRMKHPKVLAAVAASAAALFSAGCIHTEETVIHDESRVPVVFETETAGRIFYETLSKIPDADRRQETKTEVEVPFVFEHKHRVVRGPNTAFNEAVARCDTNRDGKITEEEARIFAGQVR